MKKIDVAIIGAGSAGLSARREVLKKTDNYLVFDDGILGTTCARVGCMPSKVLIQVANDYYRKHSLQEEGIRNGMSLSVDSQQVMKHVRKLRDRFVRGVTEGMSSWTDEKLVRKRAYIVGPNKITTDDEEYEVQKIIIATGTKPFIPPVLEEYKEFLVTTDEFFEMEDLPKAIAVCGLGVIGIELGQGLSRLGVDFIGINRRRKIANISDPEVNEYVCSKFEKEMNISFDGIQKIERKDKMLAITTGDKEYLVEKILVTTGRIGALDKLGINNLNVKLNKRGIPDHNDKTMQLKNVDNVFLTGDARGVNGLLHEASDEGKIAGFNAVNKPQNFNTRTKLAVTFSDPNIAVSGMSYSEIIDSGIDFESGKVLFEGQGRSIVKLKEIGMLKVYGEKQTGKLLGAELFAPDGEHLAHLLSWVISQNMSVNEVLALPFYHPVIEEGLRTALRDLRDKVSERVPTIECDFTK